MNEQWYYSSGGKQAGPISPLKLKQLASSGQLSSTDLVWKAGLPNWIPAEKIKGLFATPDNNADVPQPPPLPANTPQHGSKPDELGKLKKEQRFTQTLVILVVLLVLGGLLGLFIAAGMRGRSDLPMLPPVKNGVWR